MLDADKSHLDVTWVSQSLYSGPLSNPDFFLSLIADRIRQVVLYLKRFREGLLMSPTTYVFMENRQRITFSNHYIPTIIRLLY